MKIVLVNPLHSKDIVVFQQGTLSLATVLKKAGYEVEIIDFNTLHTLKEINFSQNSEETIEIFTKYLIGKDPDIIGFSCMCNCYHIYIKTAKALKEKKPNVKIIFGGPQATVTAKETLSAFPWIDMIALGESEKTIVDIVRVLEYDGSFKDISGAAYRLGEKIIVNKDSDLIENLDELLLMDYSLIPGFNKNNHVDIEVGRGCPFSCIYCSTKTFWKRKFRLKSIDRVIREIKYLQANYNKNSFGLLHDLFTLNKKYILEFCDRLLSEKITIKWGCCARMDTIDEVMIQKMKEAGCRTIYFGIETGSKRMQKIIKKNINLDSIDEKLDIIVKYGLRATFSFIYGFPEETRDDLNDTLRMILKIENKRNLIVQLHKCSVLAGTELYEQYKDNLNFTSNTSCVAGYLDVEFYKDIVQGNKEIFPHFYTFDCSENLQKYGDLDKYISYFYKFLKISMPNLCRILMDHYKNDLLQMYEEMIEFDKDLLNKILTYSSSMFLSQRKDLARNEFEYANLISDFILKWEFGNYTKIVREVFRYEHDVIKYKYIEKNKNKCLYYYYDYDVINIDSNSLKIGQISYSPVKICIKNDEKNMIIEKVPS